MKTTKNILVQYQGGGYDGCIWEWNFFYIDKQGDFHDVYSSGCAGIKTAAGLHVLDTDEDDVYVYNLSDVKAIETLNKEANACNVAGVLKWFEDNPQEDVEFFAVCSECNETITDYSDVCLENWHGCGGIASTADALLCSECRCNGSCGVCGEYVGSDGFDYEQDTDDCSDAIKEQLIEWDENNGPACQWCWEAERDQLIKDEREEMLQVSLATGTPDLFSDAMRWFWD